MPISLLYTPSHLRGTPEANTCDACEGSCEILVLVGEAPAWESATATICESCLIKALAMIRRAGEEK